MGGVTVAGEEEDEDDTRPGCMGLTLYSIGPQTALEGMKKFDSGNPDFSFGSELHGSSEMDEVEGSQPNRCNWESDMLPLRSCGRPPPTADSYRFCICC